MTALPSLNIGKHTASYPIVQGGMGIGVSGASLASAVANAGGIGVIATMGLGLNSPYYKKRRFSEANRLALIDEIQQARYLSPKGVLGINAMVAARDYADIVRTGAESGINLIISGAGMPLKLPEYTANYPDTALVPIVSTVDAAKVICRQWEQKYHRLPDAFVIKNSHRVGGHFILDSALKSEQVIPDLLQYLDREVGERIPLIAAGGIWSRKDIDYALSLGTAGVQIGTRFITTDECDADLNYKLFHLQANPDDVVIAPSPLGMPGRVLNNAFAQKAIACDPNLEQRCIANCLESCKCRDNRETYCIIQALNKAARGDVENGLVFTGSAAGRARTIMPVAELMQELVS